MRALNQMQKNEVFCFTILNFSLYIVHPVSIADGQVEDFKEKVETDKENKTTSHTVLEGHCLSQYRSYKAIFQVIPKREGGSVKITLEYEKLSQDIPPPKKYLDFIVHVFKDADAHLLNS